jgi:O-antigen/teichoic acid export membrane protein
MVYAAAGLGFSGANLILARVLPPAEYGIFTLVIALTNLGYSLSPAGIDGIVLRRHLEAGPQLLRRTLLACVIVGVIFAVIGHLGYGMPLPLSAVLLVSVVAGGLMFIAGVKFQSEGRFGLSLGLIQSPNLFLLVAALGALVFHTQTAWFPLVVSAAGFVIAALFGWWLLFEERAAKPHRDAWFPWSEALAFAGVSAAGLVLTQLDRLIIPHVLPFEDLATFGVLAAIAGSLFRVLQMGVGYTLVPRLRAATSVPQRRRLVAQEAKAVVAMVVAGSLAIWAITPLVERWFLRGKYELSAALLLAAIVSGMTKVLNSFTRATVTALATPAELGKASVLGWASVLVAIPAAAFGARWGLAGVMYGVAFGWLLRALTGYYITLRHLRISVPVPATRLESS